MTLGMLSELHLLCLEDLKVHNVLVVYWCLSKGISEVLNCLCWPCDFSVICQHVHLWIIISVFGSGPLFHSHPLSYESLCNINNGRHVIQPVRPVFHENKWAKYVKWLKGFFTVSCYLLIGVLCKAAKIPQKFWLSSLFWSDMMHSVFVLKCACIIDLYIITFFFLCLQE